MNETLRVDPDKVAAAAAVHRDLASDLQAALAVQSQLEAARSAHGPIFADFKAALGETLAARQAELSDQLAINNGVAETLEAEARNFAATEDANAARQAAVHE